MGLLKSVPTGLRGEKDVVATVAGKRDALKMLVLVAGGENALLPGNPPIQLSLNLWDNLECGYSHESHPF